MGHRVNIGCGITPTDGWLNFDNSLSLKLSQFPRLAHVLYRLKILNKTQIEFVRFCLEKDITWADATKRIPLASNSVEVLYCAHMLEHLDRVEATRFLQEANRVLVSGGVIRISVPDLERKVSQYLDDRDADAFMDSAYVCVPREGTLSERLKALVVGSRHHLWMYDKNSLCKLLSINGFVSPANYLAGETQIQNPDPLDLMEREAESIYVEARKE